MEQGNVTFHEKGIGRALLELAKAYEPRQAVREYVTNSIDARVPNTEEDISVLLFPREKRVIISDNGTGMDYNKLSSLSTCVGFSENFGRIDKRGEKAFGMLAFGSLGEAVHVISRPCENPGAGFGYLKWEIKKDKIGFVSDQIKASDVDRLYYSTFKHGTRVIVDRVDPHVMNETLTLANLARWFTNLYTPALRRGDINIKIGKANSNGSIKMQTLEPLIFETPTSDEIMDVTLKVPIKNENELGELEVLLFVDPNATCNKVAVYSKDVMVYNSITDIDEFRKSSVWGSGILTGYINDKFNKLVLGRDGIDRQRNAFKAWFEKVIEIEEDIRPIIEEKTKAGRKHKQDEQVRAAYNAFVKAWHMLKKTGDGEIYFRSNEGEILPVIGVSPGENTRRVGPGREHIGSGNPGPGKFRVSSGGHPERVAPRKNSFPFLIPQPIPFPLHEQNLRSKIEELCGNPIIYINSEHQDYTSRQDSARLRYIVEIMADESAFYTILRAEKEGRIKPTETSASESVKKALRDAGTIKFLTLSELGIK